MEIKDLEFREHYLYEKPTDNYARGLTVSMNNVRLFEWELDFNCEPVSQEEMFNQDFWITKPRAVLYLRNYAIPRDFMEYSLKDETVFGTKRVFLLEDIDKVKEESIKIVEKYINFFIK